MAEWIKPVIRRPGAFRAKARAAGMSTAAYARKVLRAGRDGPVHDGHRNRVKEQNTAPRRMYPPWLLKIPVSDFFRKPHLCGRGRAGQIGPLAPPVRLPTAGQRGDGCQRRSEMALLQPV